MSFGFSVGDFIAVGTLIRNISSCLQDAGGAKAEYRDLLRELECLQKALQHLDKLQSGSSSSSADLDSIRYAALSCRRPLEHFFAKIQKYDGSLGVWGKAGVIKSTTDKLKWGFVHKEEIRKLQGYLNIHVGTINIILAEHGLKKMDLASDKAAADQLHIRERLEDTRGMIKKISGSLKMQASVVGSTQNMLARLFEVVSGEFRTSWRSLGEMVAQVSVCTQQTYAVILEIKNSLAGPDIRWTFFQAPLAVEDALGYRFPVPSEYDFGLLDAVIKHKFEKGPGSVEVEYGDYEYFNTKDSNNVLSTTSRLLPGAAITMAVVVFRPTLTDETCPVRGCDSTRVVESSSGGRTCCKCNVWFSPAKKRENSLLAILSGTSRLTNPLINEDQPANTGRANKRAKLAPIEENVGMFRNVRLSSEVHMSRNYHDGDQTSKPRTRSPADEAALSYLHEFQHRISGRSEEYKQLLETVESSKRESTMMQDFAAQAIAALSSVPNLTELYERSLAEFANKSTKTRAAPTTSAGPDKGGRRKRKRV